MQSVFRLLFFAAITGWFAPSALLADYAIVVSSATHQDSAWRPVVDALLQKHQGKVYEYETSVDQALKDLQATHPRYTCFVVKPEEASRQFVTAVHQLTRQYDQDPYTDTFWGIVTGYDAAAALAIAEHRDPLVINKVAAGTEFALDACTEGRWYDELVPGKQVRKLPGSEIEHLEGPADSTAALVETLNEVPAGFVHHVGARDRA
jgi:hypothetical protein